MGQSASKPLTALLSLTETRAAIVLGMEPVWGGDPNAVQLTTAAATAEAIWRVMQIPMDLTAGEPDFL